MPRASVIQTNANAGEISPLLYGRVDLEKYKGALKKCLNAIPLVQGAWQRRPGTYFAAEVQDSSARTRLIRWNYSSSIAYYLELGHQYIRFYRNGGPVLEASKTITGITKANPGVVTSAGHGFSSGDKVELAAIGGMTELNGRRVTVGTTTADTFQLLDLNGANINTTNYTTYTSGGTASRVYTISSPWATADLFALRFAQIGTTLYVAHGSYAPRKITRTAHTSWTVSQMDWLDGPYLSNNGVATYSSAASGSSTITSGSPIFASTDVGRVFRSLISGTWHWFKITAFTNTSNVTATVRSSAAVPTGTASTQTRMGVWSDTTGWPATVAVFENRLVWGGTTDYPGRVDLSASGGSYEDYGPSDTSGTIAADDAASFTLASDDVQTIQWMADDEKGLLIGTASGEWVLRPSNQQEAVSPTNINAKQVTAYGSKTLAGARCGKAVLFADRGGRKIREMAYVFDVDGFRAPDLTRLSEHITLGGVDDMAYQQNPQSVLWMARGDGELVGFTYEREESVLGWHHHQLGGYSDSGHTAIPEVESVACGPSTDGSRDEVWMIVKRYIGGRVVRYVEYMTKMWERGDTQEDFVGLDCALTYDSTATTSITGLHHLAGETVNVMADGSKHAAVTVSATGAVTLTRSASVVHVGYDYNADGQSLRNNAGAADGTAQGKKQKQHKVIFRVHDMGDGFYAGPDFDNLDQIHLRTSDHDAGEMLPLQSGDIDDEAWDGDYSTENLTCWRVKDGYPGTILAYMPRVNTQDGL